MRSGIRVVASLSEMLQRGVLIPLCLKDMLMLTNPCRPCSMSEAVPRLPEICSSLLGVKQPSIAQ